MSNLFENYEQEFSGLTAELTKFVTAQIPSQTGDARKQTIRKAERCIDEAMQLLEQMDLEVREQNASIRPRLQQRMRTYRKEVERLESDLRKCKLADTQMDREELFGGHNVGGAAIGEYASSNEQRTRLLTNTDRLRNADRHLDNALRTAVDASSTGDQILSELDRQGRVLDNMKQNLDKTDSTLTKASRILSAMTRRIIQNKILMAFIIIFLIGLIILIIYLKLFAGSGDEPVVVNPSTITTFLPSTQNTQQTVTATVTQTTTSTVVSSVSASASASASATAIPSRRDALFF
eukprot:Colp12_sorted_trinity150504_noHs@16808